MNGCSRTWKEYFEERYYINIEEQLTLSVWGFNLAGKGNDFVGDPLRQAGIEVRAKS